jgi:hypothetical protein
MRSNEVQSIRSTLVSILLAGLAVSTGASAQAKQDEVPSDKPGQHRVQKAKARRETAASWRARRAIYYQRNWGVDIVGVRPVSSGYMLRFDYRILDPEKAAVLKDRKSKAYLIDEKTNTALAVPAMENIGELRQVAPLEVNRTYFMIFGNPGKLVKSGSRVTIVVGTLRVEGLVVD